MVDLRPDTSIYPKQQQMGLGDLLGFVSKSRELEEEQAAAEALKGNTDKDTGQVNTPGAVNDYLAKAGSRANPNRIGEITRASEAVYKQRQAYMHEALGAVASTIYDEKMTPERFSAELGPALRRAGVPEKFIIEAGRAAPGESFHSHAVRIQQWLSNNAAPSTMTTVGPSGEPVVKLPGQVLDPNAGGGEGEGGPEAGGGGRGNVTVTAPRAGMTSGGPAAPGGGGEASRPPGGDFEPVVPKTSGLYRAGFSPEEAKQRAASGAQSEAVLKSGQDINQTRADLRQLDNMSREAAAGPASDFSKRWSTLMNQAGMPELATMTPQQVASTEGYNKIVSRMIDRMGQASGGTTNEYLHNYQASNPSTMMSRAGRSGVVHWLEGLNDSQNLVYREWNAWLGKHPQDQGQFTRWLASPKGMDAGKFDPRVFQYQRMTPEERKDFRGDMDEKDKKLFHQHYNLYEKRGWLEQARGE